MISNKITRRTFLDLSGKILGSAALMGCSLFEACAMEKDGVSINFKGSEILSLKEKTDAKYFQITSGNDLNLLYQGEEISANILLSSKIKNRIVVAFLNGNSCGAIWFDEKEIPENSNLILQTEGKVEEVIMRDGRKGILFKVATGRKNLTITDIIADSVRAARDRSHCTYKSYREKNLDRVLWRKEFAKNNPEINIPPAWISPSVEIINMEDGKSAVKFYRTTLDEKFYVYGELLFPEYVNVTLKEKGFIEIEGEKDITFDFLSTSAFPSLHPFTKEELISKDFLDKIEKPEKTDFHNVNEKLSKALKHYTSYYSSSLRDLLFLSYKDAFLAGSWRFLTYFGRDTMMTVMLLGEVISKEGYEAGMESILERLSPDGSVAHEDNSWWQAEGERVCKINRLISEGKRKEAEEILKRLYDENYDYKMVDDDFMFPVMLLNYLKRSDMDPAFMSKKSYSSVLDKHTDNKIAIMKNFNKVLEKALPYFKAYKSFTEENYPDGDFREKEENLVAKNLIRIHKGEMTGDWRDSNTGLGLGVYPGNVNLYLVPAALKAVYAVLKNHYGFFDSIENMKKLSEENNLHALLEMVNTFTEDNTSRVFYDLIKCWKNCRNYFKVTLTPEDIRKRVMTFINENPGFSKKDKDFFLSLPVSYEETLTVKDFIDGKTPEILKNGLEYYGLSLDENCKPVEVINSDTGFGFVLDELSIEEIENLYKTALLNYPLGLMTDGGLLTASPALSNNKELWEILSPGAYHGTVVWSWQMTMMEKGLISQAYKMPTTDQLYIVPLMYSLAAKMIEIENNLGAMRNFELWGIEPDYASGKIKAVPYGEGAEAESNAVQLWSTLALTMVNPFMFP